ncbi:MAG: hypothetical protein NC483_02285 [Ruminococcus sp.]|nr:hypothetical protein [Ruminococcus sp.]
MNLKNIKIKDIKDIDYNFAFFHYTNLNNLPSIDKNGLLPKIGESATGIELTEKIFFAIGSKGVFSIFDSWIRWLIAKRLTDLPGQKADIPFYRFCTFIMKMPIIRHLIAGLINIIVWLEFHFKPFKAKSFKIMKEILDNSCFLLLNLEEEIDFSYKDIDEVKHQKFDRKLLKTVYAKQHKMDSKKMDYWNMHTFSNITIPQNKITLLKLDDTYSCIDILLWMIKNTKYDLKVFSPYLYEFLNFYNLLDK